VIDEIVGMQIVLLLATPRLGGVLLAFLFFRIFDVVKPFPAGRAQRFPGGYGVVFDDVFAALYARLSMVVAAHFFPVLGEFF
jgi:phosphatidylglycerophosphatase A